MIDRSDWEAVYRDLVRDERGRLGELPPVEEFLAFTEGALPAARAERVREFLSVYPELARDLGGLPSEPPLGARDYASDAEVEEGWAALEPHLRSMAAAQDSVRWSEPRRRFASSQPATLAASILAAVLGALYWGAHREIAQLEAELQMPRANFELRLLLPDGYRGGNDLPILLSVAQEDFLLRPSLINQPDYPDYRLRILRVVDGKEIEVWNRNGLRRGPNDTFEVWMPRSFLQPGEYCLKLSGIPDRDVENLLATYTIRLDVPSSRKP